MDPSRRRVVYSMLLGRSLRVAAHCPRIPSIGGLAHAPTLAVRCFATKARKENREEENGFKKLGVNPVTIRLLKSRYNITRPTEVQEQSLPLTLNRKSCIIQSPTGSGKSLSFLIPALEDASPGLSTVILAPTRELATQLHQWSVVLAGTRKSSKKVLLCVSGMTGEREVVDPLEEEEEEERKNGESGSSSDIRDKKSVSPMQAEPPNIVIATPKKLLELLNNRTFTVRNLRRVVLDECDKLVAPLNPQRATWRARSRRDKHPRPASLVLNVIREKLRKRHLQLICTSATADLGVKEELLRLGWPSELPVIQCSSSTTTPTVIQHHYMLVKDEKNSVLDKIDLLVDHFVHAGGGQPALVFIHRGAKIDQFVWNLRSRGMRVVALYEKMNDSEEYKEFLERFQAGQIQLAVGTEETVRGLDFPWVQTVYITEVPRTAQEYLHLCGRVGRVGRAGQAVVLLVGSELPRLFRHYAKLSIKGTELEDNAGELSEQNGCCISEEQSLDHTT